MKLFDPEKPLAVVHIPSSALSAGFDADFSLGVLFDKVQGQTTNGREALLSVA